MKMTTLNYEEFIKVKSPDSFDRNIIMQQINYNMAFALLVLGP